jgi:hypothetical protein
LKAPPDIDRHAGLAGTAASAHCVIWFCYQARLHVIKMAEFVGCGDVSFASLADVDFIEPGLGLVSGLISD